MLVAASLADAPAVLAKPKPPKPTVSNFSAAPSSVGVDGAHITLAGLVSNATSCTFSSSKTISGLPTTVPCSNSAVSVGLALPANASKRQVPYKLTLAVTGPGGSLKVTATATVAAPPKGETCRVTPGAQLVGCNLSYADLDGANLEGTNLKGADLYGVSSGGITGTPSALPTHWQLINGYLIGPGARLHAPQLRAANLVGADLEDAQLEGGELDFADLRNANLAGANLSHTTIFQADLESADLDSADLEGGELNFADLRNANLAGANLSHASIFEADLESANLEDANVQGSYVEVANLEGANLKDTEPGRRVATGREPERREPARREPRHAPERPRRGRRTLGGPLVRGHHGNA